MKIIPGILLALLLIAGMESCSHKQEAELSEEPSGINLQQQEPLNQDAVPNEDENALLTNGNKYQDQIGGIISSGAAVVLDGDSARKLIKTAELRFRVKNVAGSTVQIEDITARMGGFVIRTTVKSNILNTATIKLSADSLLETMTYSVSSSILIRVPVAKLDTTLKAFAPLIDYLDYRHIRVRDVEMEIKANEKRQQRYRTATRPSTKPEKTEDKSVTISNSFSTSVVSYSTTQDAAERRLQHHLKADEAELSNMSLEDQIRYSTITLDIYERSNIRRTVLADHDNIKAYKPGAGSRLRTSFETGWEVLVTVLEFLFKLWGLFLFAAIIYAGIFIYRKYFVKIKKDKHNSSVG